MLAYQREKVNLTVIFLFLFVMFALLLCLLFMFYKMYSLFIRILRILFQHCLLSVLTGGPTLHVCPKCEMTEENSDTSYYAFSCHSPLHGLWFLGRTHKKDSHACLSCLWSPFFQYIILVTCNQQLS